MQKNILFLLGRYLPNPSANGICCKNVIDELINEGHKVTCITYEDYEQEIYTNENLKIYRITRGIVHKALYKAEKNNKKYLKKLLNIINKIKMIPFIIT